MAKAAKKHALDIFRTLNAIDRHDMNYYNGLSDEEKKGYASPVVMRWVSDASPPLNDWNLISVNERANVHHFALYEHAELQYKILASVGMGMRTRHEWIPSGKKDQSGPLHDFITKYWSEANALEVEVILKYLREGDNLKLFLDGTGMSSDEIKRVQKLFS